MSAKEKEMIVTKMSLSYCNYVILNQRSSCNQHTQTHMICARNNELGKSGEQMSSVPDQLQRVVGKSHNAAFQADNKHVQGGDGGLGDGRREKAERDESESETAPGWGTHAGRHSGTLSAARRKVCVRVRQTDRQRQCSRPAGLAVM